MTEPGRWSLETPGVVELPGGRRVRATSLRRRGAVSPPDHGVYLLGRDPGLPWPYRWVRWRDLGLPSSTDDALEALQDAYARAESQRVEIGCGGGVGRTGTALAVLAVLGGVRPSEAVDWAREHHHRRAVETGRQRRWVEQVTTSLL